MAKNEKVEKIVGNPSASPIGAAAASSPGEKTEKIAEELRGRKPYTKRRDKAETEAAYRAEMEKVLNPETLEGLAQMPGELGLALTGWEGFLLSEKETRVLATSAATAGRYVVDFDPKWAAIAIFAANFLVCYGGRLAQYFIELKKARKADAHAN